MRKYINIVLWIGVIVIIALAIREVVETNSRINNQEELFERVDSTLSETDSVLCCVEKNIQVTDSLTNVLREYNKNQAIRTDSIFDRVKTQTPVP